MSWTDARNQVLGAALAATCACAPMLPPSAPTDVNTSKKDANIVAADTADAPEVWGGDTDVDIDVSDVTGDVDVWDVADNRLAAADAMDVMDAAVGSDIDAGGVDAADVLDCSAGPIEGCLCTAKEAISGWACCDYWNATMALDCAQSGFEDKATFRYEWVSDVCECLDSSDPKSCRPSYDPHPGWCPKQ
jgi:hypothetical protein